VTTVECQSCGARYETDLPAAAVARVRRCRGCGRTTLKVIDDEPKPVTPTSDRLTARCSGRRHPDRR